MIIKIMPKVTLAYQVGLINSKGAFRESTIVDGNYYYCKMAIEAAVALHFKNPELHMVFRECASFEELGGYEMQNKLIKLIHKVFFPGVKNPPPILFVQHRPLNEDKNDGSYSYEINAIIPQIVNGKKFIFHDFIGGDFYLRKAFSCFLHKAFPQFTHPDTSPNYFSYAKTWSSNAKETCKVINSLVHNEMKKGSLRTKEDICLFLKGQGFEVVLRKNYISLTNQDGSKIRLKGRVFDPAFDFKALKANANIDDILPRSLEEYEKELDYQISKREERLMKKYPYLYQDLTQNENSQNNTNQDERRKYTKKLLELSCQGSNRPNEESGKRELSDFEITSKLLPNYSSAEKSKSESFGGFPAFSESFIWAGENSEDEPNSNGKPDESDEKRAQGGHSPIFGEQVLGNIKRAFSNFKDKLIEKLELLKLKKQK